MGVSPRSASVNNTLQIIVAILLARSILNVQTNLERCLKMSFTLYDTDAVGAKTTKITVKTNLGYVVFWTDSGSVFEACSRIKSQLPCVIWADRYHARIQVGA